MNNSVKVTENFLVEGIYEMAKFEKDIDKKAVKDQIEVKGPNVRFFLNGEELKYTINGK